VPRVRGHWLTLVALLGAMLALGGVVWAVRAPWWRAASLERETATFVGRQACASCHPQQDKLWRGSDHDLAMQPADEQSMLGDFGGATLTHRGVTSHFFRRDGKFFARTEGPDGRLGHTPACDRRPAVVPPLSRRANPARRSPALDRARPDVESHVRRVPLDQSPEELSAGR
jgi:hypothetical protein